MKNWKLLFLMAVIVPALSFTSCSDDDEDPIDLKTEIVGNWKWQNQELKGLEALEGTDYEGLITTIKGFLTTYSPYKKDVVAGFKADNTLTLSGGNVNQAGTYEIKNNQTVITKLGDDGIAGLDAEYTATINGEELTLTMSNDFIKKAIDSFPSIELPEAMVNLLLKTFKFSIIFEKVQ